MREKDIFWEMIKGLCIVSVVFIHSKVGADYAGTSLSWNFHYWVIERQFINFAVPVFIFMSAYFTSIEKIEQNYATHYVKRIKRLLLPFLIWSTVYTIINIMLDYLTKDTINWLSYIVNFITGRAGTPFYFIIVLIQLTLITPLLIRASKSKWWNRIALLGTPLYLIILYLYQYETKNQMPNYEIFFPAWFIFYYLGILSKVRGIEYIRIIKERVYSHIFLLLMLIMSIAEAYSMLDDGLTSGAATSQIKVSSFLFSYALINCFLLEKETIMCKLNRTTIKVLSKIGEYSYGIFFIHCIFRKLMSLILGFIPVIDNVLPLYQFLQATSMLFLSILCIKIVIRVLGKERASLWLGF